MTYESIVNRIVMMLAYASLDEIHEAIVVQGGVDEETFFFAYHGAKILIEGY